HPSTGLKDEGQAALPAGGEVLVEVVVGSEETDAERVGKPAASRDGPIRLRPETGCHTEEGHGRLCHLEAFQQVAMVEQSRRSEGLESQVLQRMRIGALRQQAHDSVPVGRGGDILRVACEREQFSAAIVIELERPQIALQRGSVGDTTEAFLEPADAACRFRAETRFGGKATLREIAFCPRAGQCPPKLLRVAFSCSHMRLCNNMHHGSVGCQQSWNHPWAGCALPRDREEELFDASVTGGPVSEPAGMCCHIHGGMLYHGIVEATICR